MTSPILDWEIPFGSFEKEVIDLGQSKLPCPPKGTTQLPLGIGLRRLSPKGGYYGKNLCTGTNKPS